MRKCRQLCRMQVLFWRRLSVCLCVCVCVCLPAQNLENYWSEIDVTWQEYVTRGTLEVLRSWWHLTLTFDLESYFRILQLRLYLSNGFTWQLYVWYGDTSSDYLGHSLVSKSWVQGQDHSSAKAVACNSKTTGRKLLELDQNICYDNARSNSELLTFDLDLWPLDTFLLSFPFKLEVLIARS